MVYSTQEQLCFPPVEGLTVSGSFDGGCSLQIYEIGGLQLTFFKVLASIFYLTSF